MTPLSPAHHGSDGGRDLRALHRGLTIWRISAAGSLVAVTAYGFHAVQVGFGICRRVSWRENPRLNGSSYRG